MAILAPHYSLAAVMLLLSLVVAGFGVTGILLSSRGELPRLLSIPAFALASNAAAIHAGVRALQGKGNPLWEPTRREVIAPM